MLMVLTGVQGTPAPEASVTRPVMRPVATCADRDTTESKATSRKWKHFIRKSPLTRPSVARMAETLFRKPGVDIVIRLGRELQRPHHASPVSWTVSLPEGSEALAAG